MALELRRAGKALAARPSAEIADVLGRVGERFVDESDRVRHEALQSIPSTAGVSNEMAGAILDGMANDWTRERLHRLLEVEFGRPSPLDGLVEDGGRAAMAIGPRLCAQFVAGSVPGVSVTALTRSLLVKGPTFLKPGSGDVTLPVIYAGALREEDPALADALAVVHWPGGSMELEDALVAEADVVTVYGSDLTVSRVRARLPVTTRLVGYHHRVSVGIVGRAALLPEAVAETAADVASAVGMFDQRGCVCPQVIYVEEGGAVPPSDLASHLARASADFEIRLPSGRLDVAEAAALHQLRGNAELQAATSTGHVDHGGARASWTVVYEPEPMTGTACLARAIRVRPLRDAIDLADELASDGLHLQTVGFAGLGERVHHLAPTWGGLGASRVVPFREMSFPPPWWLHDGRRPLQELVRWVEIRSG